MSELDEVKKYAREMGIALEDVIYPALDTHLRKAGGIEFIENIGEIPTVMIEDAFDPESPYLKGYRTRFYGWSDGKVVFRPNELTVWTGYNGHGKTQFVNQLALEMIDNGAKVCIASLEMSKRVLIRRLFKQASGLTVPTPGYLHAIRQHYSHKLFLFDHLGAIDQRKLLNAFKEVLEIYGVDVFIIDSLMKCGILEDDYNAQKLFIDMLCDFKFAHRCHIHLIAHPRKGMHENGAPGKMDIKGTGTITDLADNAFSVWRNKPKEAYLANNPNDEEEKKKADAVVYCNKQRNGDWEGQLHLWYHRGCYQFLQSYGAKPNEYVKYDQRQDTLDYLRSIPDLQG